MSHICHPVRVWVSCVALAVFALGCGNAGETVERDGIRAPDGANADLAGPTADALRDVAGEPTPDLTSDLPDLPTPPDLDVAAEILPDADDADSADLAEIWDAPDSVLADAVDDALPDTISDETFVEVVPEVTCTPDCTGLECGDDGCGGSCGTCEAGCQCGAGQCIGSCGGCTPACAGKACGPDGCGGTCGTCAANESCAPATGQCLPGPCDLPTTFPGPAFRVNSLAAGKDGTPGEAVDVDSDAATCAPENACQDGLDNSFGALMKSLAPFLGGDEPINAAVEAGDLMVVMELVEPTFDSTPFVANMYRAAAAAPKESCDFQAEPCDYLALPESFDPVTCLPESSFDNAQISGDVLTAGGPGYATEFPFLMEMMEGEPILFPASHARVVAALSYDEQGAITGIGGILAGAVPKAAIVAMVDEMPDNALPISKDLIVNVLEMVVKADIDADGDGTPESVSTCLKFSAIPGTLTGLGSDTP